jgi:hypothetical protein
MFGESLNLKKVKRKKTLNLLTEAHYNVHPIYETFEACFLVLIRFRIFFLTFHKIPKQTNLSLFLLDFYEYKMLTTLSNLKCHIILFNKQ